LAGRVAIVTGGGQGVGFGIARAFAAAGASVVVMGRKAETLAAAREAIVELGSKGFAVVGDVTKADDVQRCVDDTVAMFGRIDILVNNAQEISMGPVLELTEEDMERNWRSGPLAAFRFMKACHSHLRGAGVVINMFTASGLRWDTSGGAAYGGAKEAMRVLSRAAACEWGADGIRVVGIMPFVATPAWDAYRLDHPDDAAKLLAEIPMGRMGDAELDVGRAAVFLASDDAAFITGTTLTVDGGKAFLR
jgi:hypothetical protein